MKQHDVYDFGLVNQGLTVEATVAPQLNQGQ